MQNKRSTPASGPLAGYEPGYRAELVERGYKPRTVTTLIRLMRRLSCWMESGDYAVGNLSSAVAEEFLAEVRASGRRFQPTLATLSSLFEYLRRVDAVPAELAPPSTTGIGVTVEGFRRYLEIERGLVPDTVATYARATTTFLSWLHAHSHVDMARLTARDVVEFVTDLYPGHSTGWAKLSLTGLRSFLRFAHLTGLVPVSLVGAAPSAAGWSGYSLPRGLAPGDVKRLLASCDRRRAKGRRDHAILLLLVRLGLRAAEVADLSLEDVDWLAGEMVING